MPTQVCVSSSYEEWVAKDYAHTTALLGKVKFYTIVTEFYTQMWIIIMDHHMEMEFG